MLHCVPPWSSLDDRLLISAVVDSISPWNIASNHVGAVKHFAAHYDAHSLAQAIGEAAIQQGYHVSYRETHQLLELAEATIDGTRKSSWNCSLRCHC